jgi:hypothetical protein
MLVSPLRHIRRIKGADVSLEYPLIRPPILKRFMRARKAVKLFVLRLSAVRNGVPQT